MLKNLGYYGTYHDKRISISVLLENPQDYGFDPSDLLFSVTVRDKQSDTGSPLSMEDFSFYIMDEQHCIYNTKAVLDVQPYLRAAADDESSRRPNGLIFTDFRAEFLFQDLRVVAYCKPSLQFYIIELRR